MSQVFSTFTQENSTVRTLVEQVTEIGKQLKQRKWRVSCAESCTGGGLAYYFTSVSGSSEWFDRSWVTYSNLSKNEEIGVNNDILNQFGAVSSETVLAMAEGVSRESGAEIALSVSGVAGPGGGSQEKPVGTVWFGFYLNGNNYSCKKVFEGDRAAVREQAIAFAISILHQWLVDPTNLNLTDFSYRN